MIAASDVNRQVEELSRRLASVERENAELLKLVVATRRLGESTTTRSALAAIRDIIVTVIGSEDFAVYLVEPAGVIRWVSGMGCFGAVSRHFKLNEGPLGKAVATRSIYVAEQMEAGLDHLDGWPFAAAVPFVLGEHLLGAFAIFRTLPHREPLTLRADGDMLRFVGTQAAAALALGDLLAREASAEAVTA